MKVNVGSSHRISFLILLCFLMSVSRTVLAEPTKSPQQPTISRDLITIQYEITFDSFYTGDQSLISYTGSLQREIGSCDRGDNGLPIDGYFPIHMLLPFTRWNGQRAVLLVPTCGFGVTSLLKPDGLNGSYGIYMTTVVDTSSNVVTIRAYPRLIKS